MNPRGSLSWLSIFTSTSTLLCCALPALLVALGAGAALSSLIGAFPQIVWLSENKTMLFIVASAILLAAGVVQWRARRASASTCPRDRDLAQACATAKDASHVVFLVSLSIYAIGAFFAFIAPLLM